MARRDWFDRPITGAARFVRLLMVGSLLAGAGHRARPVMAGSGHPITGAARFGELLKTDSRAPYVHRLTLYAEDGTVISPTDALPQPYSPRATCGKCHPYDEIRRGWHFNAADPNLPAAEAGRPGEPWLLVDKQTGAALPISGRRWAGTCLPADAGLSNWQFIKTFGAHTPGGSFGEPDEVVIRNSAEKARWAVSGRLEIDCMFCHSADQQHDPAELARQIEAENFRWAPTVALGLAVIRGEARKAPDDWDPLAAPDPERPQQAGPRLIYDKTRFDPDERVLFNVTGRPPNERCYFCHSLREVGFGATDDLLASQDVHLVAGLLCVDCHRHGVDHDMVRGYEGEAAQRGRPLLAVFSCEGCHLGVADGAEPGIALGGRYRAPRPRHDGLPPVHFEKLTCTACHSGPWPELNVKRFQTALAHRLGLAARDRNDHMPPRIVGPIFAPQADGKIAPHMMAWPIVTHGEHPSGAKPYLWCIAHDVRPAAQALGVRGCQDCHALDAPLDFGKLVARDEPADQAPRIEGLQPVDCMLTLRGDESGIRRAWALAFRARAAFKWFGFVCAGLVVLPLTGFLIETLGRYGTLRATSAGRTTAGAQGLTRFEHVVHWVAILGALVGAVTGFGPKLVGAEVSEWTLLVHMLGAPLFMVGLTGVALQWGQRCRARGAGEPAGGLTAAQRCMFWIILVAGLAVLLSMQLAMLPAFATATQETLKEIHAGAALVLVVAMLPHTAASLAARRQRRAARRLTIDD